jgi:hypothetical protein
MNMTRIVVDAASEAKVKLAARELSHYLKKLFNVSVAIKTKAKASRGLAIALRQSSVVGKVKLSDQGYAFRRRQTGDGDTFEIIGGSPTAVLWGVYELAESWGVRFLLHRDVLPAPRKPSAIVFPEATVREPIIRQRGFRTYNDWPNTPCQWSLKQVAPLLNQLAKMRINEIMIMQRPSDPFVHFEWRGVKKNWAGVNYGYRLPLHKDMIGYEHFKASSDATRGEFGNADLAFHDSYEATVRAGERYLRGLIRMAHARGIKVNAMIVLTDFPEAIKQKLVEVSDRKFLRRPDPGHIVTIRYGRCTEGMTKDVTRCMTIRNPRYLELIRHSLQTHIQQMGRCDRLILGVSEFRQTGADVTLAWRDLDRRYRLGEIVTFDELVRAARKNAEVSPERAETELRSDICTLWLYDYLLNVHPPLFKGGGPELVPGGLSVELHRLLPRIFPQETMYLATMGYMPSWTIKRADTLSPAREGKLRFSMILSTEDDNVGIVPQYSGPSVAGMADLIRRNGMHGFITRQFMHSKLLPALHYLTHASWERRLKLGQSHQHLFAAMCGPRAWGPLARAIRILEKQTTRMHERFEQVSFLSPKVITAWWALPGTGTTPVLDKTEKFARYAEIRHAYARAAALLAEAARKSLPSGREVVVALQRQADFAVDWMGARIAMGRANHLYLAAFAAQKRKEVEAFAAAIDECEERLRETRDLVRRATQAWADCVEDRCDLGVLAALNLYAVKPIEAIHSMAELDRISWSIHD